jgi:anti-sigma B factor antagonist
VTGAASAEEGTMDRDDDGPAIECRIDLQNGSARIRPIGELDIATAPFLEQCLDGVRSAAVDDIVLDFSGTTFIDSAALHVTVAWHARALRERFRFAVTRGPAAVGRAIEAAGLGASLNFVE